MKHALVLFNKDWFSREQEDIICREVEVELTRLCGGEWLARSGTEDGEMRMRDRGIEPSTEAWKSFYSTWLSNVLSPDREGYSYLAVVCATPELGRANTTIVSKVNKEYKYTRDFQGLFKINDDHSLSIVSAFGKTGNQDWSQPQGRVR